ncbi:MAG: SCO family protein [Aquihabitans sp.]
MRPDLEPSAGAPAPKNVTSHGALSRRRLLGFGAAAAAGAALSACGLDRASTPDKAADLNAGWGGTLLDPPLFTKPEVTLTDFDGKPFPFVESTGGKLTVLFFGYTNCPDVCPVYLQTMARALESIGPGPGSRPQVLFVGVDVARDTPDVLKAYLGKIDPTFIGLTGSEHDIAGAITHMKMPEVQIGEAAPDGSYEVGHPSQVSVFTRDNKCHRIYPSNVRQQQWAQDLPRLDVGVWK